MTSIKRWMVTMTLVMWAIGSIGLTVSDVHQETHIAHAPERLAYLAFALWHVVALVLFWLDEDLKS